MKKNINKNNNKSQKTKIQVKIKSKNVTNNFILTPRTHSALDKKDTFTKIDKFTEEMKSEKQKFEQSTHSKTYRDNRTHDYRTINTDHQKLLIKKSYLEDTGTHTPFLKKISYTSDSGHKKKSSNSEANLKLKKKSKSKLIKSQSTQFDKSTIQRIIGVIVRDYKQGRLKQKQLEQTLIQLYQRKDRKKSLTKKLKKKGSGYQTFSNDMIKEFHSKSEALNRRQKKSQQIYEGVLEREGFVNKIIIKGITTSLFLKEEVDIGNIKQKKQKQYKNLFKTPQVDFNTSHSVIQLNEDIKRIRQFIETQKSQNEAHNLYERMAIKIQKAWRGYKTRKILRSILQPKQRQQNKQMNAFHIVDQFTDEQNDQAYTNAKFTRNIVRQQGFGGQQLKKYSQIIKLISHNLNQKNLSKQQCLNNILRFLKIEIKIQEPQQNTSQKPQLQKKVQICDNSVQSQDNAEDDDLSQAESYKLIKSRVKCIQQQYKIQKTSKQIENFEQGYSNQLKSFTNKYSSKDAAQNRQMNHLQFMNTQQMDQSLTFAHSQTSAHESFKMINIKNIEEGLRTRQQNLMHKKQKQMQVLTQRLFANKINKDEYQREKGKIDKLYKNNERQLKKVRNTLLKSCLDAKRILQNDILLNTEKSQKMLKCLSDKYIKKNNWSLKIKHQTKQRQIRSSSKRIQSQLYQKQQNNQKQGQDDVNFFVYHSDEKQDQKENHANLGLVVSPKLNRHEKIEEQGQNGFKFEQIQKIIDEDEDIEDGLYNMKINKNISDKFQANYSNQLQQEQLMLINKLINETAKKFKYLCNEDKQDIFEFLFLDLVLEMFTEPYTGQAKILRTSEVYINKMKRLKKIPKGIKTNINYCKQYLKILQDNILLQDKLAIMSYPMGPTAFQMLRYMRDQIVQEEQQESLSTTVVLPIKFFQTIAKTKVPNLQLQPFYQDHQREQHRITFLKNIYHIFNKALFDSLNEMLDHQRPYGIWGKPFPWKKVIAIDRKWTKQQSHSKLKKSIDKTVQSCSYLCGILVDKQDSLFGAHKVSQQYLTHLREDRLSKMLANDLIQNEERWIFYDDETTQILIQVNNYIINKLIKECVMELVGLSIRY